MSEIKKALGLLMNMVICGKNLTETSMKQIDKALNELDIFISEVERLKQENKQLIEALRKCDPGYIVGDDDDNSYYKCSFCNWNYDDGHTDDCEYIRLTKEDNN